MVREQPERPTHWIRQRNGDIEHRDLRDETRMSQEMHRRCELLLDWICEDDGTAMQQAEIEWCILDVIDQAVLEATRPSRLT